MKGYFLGFFAILFLCSCQQETTNDTVPKQYTIEQFMNNTQIFGASFYPDDSRILVSSDQSGIFNAYAVPVDGSEMEALTNSKAGSVFSVSTFPEDNRILYRSDNNGNEIWHLFLRNEDGSVQELTPDSTARALFYGWAYDLKSFFYGYNKRDSRFMDIYEMDIEDFESNLVYQNDGGYDFGGISDDKRYIAFSKAVTMSDSDLFIYDRESQDLTKVSENQSAYFATDFGKDNNTLYYRTNDGGEYMYLMRYLIDSGTREKVMEVAWDISYAYFSRTGKYRVVGINEDGKTVVNITDMKSGKLVDFPKFEKGDITSVSISRSEKLMSFYVGSSDSPSNLYVYNFESKEHKKLTNTLNSEIDPNDLVAADVVRYASFDNVEIPAIYYKPKQASVENPVPAMVYVHGGPGGQTRQTYNPLIQYMVNHGYAVLGVNNRGSSGYGRTFNRMDDKNHGENDLMDCVYGKKYMQTLDYIDGEKIGIIGGSYGGFMTMAALVHQPEEFEVGVNIFGVTNWLRTLKSIPPWWESFKDALYEEMGDPYQDSVRLHRISPLFHADQITKPVMVLQGATDPRVLQVESDEIVEAARKNGIPVEYVLFEDEGHGFVKKENRIEAYGKILEFLNEHLKKEGEIKG